jgi:hypothetical protein
MRSKREIYDHRWRVIPASIIAGVALLAFSYHFFIYAERHGLAVSCTGEVGAPQIEHISGVITVTEFAQNSKVWYLSRDGRRRAVSSCTRYRGDCHLNFQLDRAIGQTASATFCQGVRLTLDIGQKRIDTYEDSWNDVYIFAITHISIAAFLFLFIRYGYKIPLIGLLFKGSRGRHHAIERRFSEIKLHSNDERFCFSGDNATTVFDFVRDFDSEKTGGIGVSLTRLCKNPHGEYFHVIILGQQQHVKHLSKARAHQVLQDNPEVQSREFGSQFSS